MLGLYIAQLMAFFLFSLFNIIGGEVEQYDGCKIYYLLDYKGIYNGIMDFNSVRNIWLYLFAIIWIPIVFVANMFFYLNALPFKVLYFIFFSKVTAKIFLKDKNV